MHSDSWILGLVVVALVASMLPVMRIVRARRERPQAPTREVAVRRATIAFSATAGAIILPFVVIGAVVAGWVLFSH